MRLNMSKGCAHRSWDSNLFCFRLDTINRSVSEPLPFTFQFVFFPLNKFLSQNQSQIKAFRRLRGRFDSWKQEHYMCVLCTCVHPICGSE